MQLAIAPRLPRRPDPPPEADVLRDRLGAHIGALFADLLDPDVLAARAEDLRVVQRERLHHAGLVACALVLSSFARSTDTQGRFLDAMRTYRQIGGPQSSPRSFRNMARKLLPLLRDLLARAMQRLRDASRERVLEGRMGAFADVLIPDGCAFKLARLLATQWPGTGQPAEMKLHAVYSVRAGHAVRFEATAGSVHDSDGFHPESWEAGALYIWDLGYNGYGRLIDAVRAGAHVLQRLKENANPVVLASYGATAHRRELHRDDDKPMRLNEACEFGHVHKQRQLDLDVRFDDEQGRHETLRVVCVPCNGDDHYYLTSLSRETFTVFDVAELYRIRWEIELLFRNWKGACRLDEVRRLSHPASLDVAITASLLASVLSADITVWLEQFANVVDDETAPRDAAFPPGAANDTECVAFERARRRAMLAAAIERRTHDIVRKRQRDATDH